MYEPNGIVSTAAELRQIHGDVLFSQDTKCINHIDEHCRNWHHSKSVNYAPSAPGSHNALA